MSEKVLVLSADRWEMVDDKTGEELKGVSAWYVNSYREDEKGSIGQKPTKVSATPETFAIFEKSGLPGVYELEYGSRPGKGGKAALALIGAKFIESFDLTRFNLKKVA